MQETAKDLDALQQLPDRSYANAGAHLSAIFTETSRLSAAEVADSLAGIFEMHLATTTADGAPFVAPIDGLFFKGKIWFGVPAAAIRAKHVRRDARVSASYTRDQSFTFVVHGEARGVTPSDALFATYVAYMQECYVALYGTQWLQRYERRQQTTGDDFTGYIESKRLFVKR